MYSRKKRSEQLSQDNVTSEIKEDSLKSIEKWNPYSHLRIDYVKQLFRYQTSSYVLWRLVNVAPQSSQLLHTLRSLELTISVIALRVAHPYAPHLYTN